MTRSLRYYNLDAILAVGYHVRSHRGTLFRQSATARFREGADEDDALAVEAREIRSGRTGR